MSRNVGWMAWVGACALAACGGDGAARGDGDAVDGETVVPDGCVAITPAELGVLMLDGQDDVSTSYSYPLTARFGATAAPDFLVLQFINYNERIGPLAVGTFPLDEAPNDNFGTCPECVAVWVDQPSLNLPPAKFLFQRAGTIRLDVDPRTKRLKGRIDGLELQEIEVDPMTLASTFVAGGVCARLTEPLVFDFTWVPAEWTCDAARYNADDACDCGCGVDDPDCYDDDYEPVGTWRGCDEGQVCHFGECRVPCSVFPPTEACASGTCLVDWPDDLCSNDGLLVDAAAIGQRCTKPGAQACAIADGIQTGRCSNNDDTPVCRPLCTRRSDCGADEYCWLDYAGGQLGVGKGYCLAGVSAMWLCEADKWRDGAMCDCGCGDIDPDCDDPSHPVRGCESGQVCDANAWCAPP